MTTIMVPTDGSEASDKAVPVGAQLARAQGGEVLLVRVLQPVPLEYQTYDTALDPDVYENLVKTIEDQAQSEVARIRDDLTARSIKTRAITPHGFAASTLLDTEQTERPDLVVMATHGRTGLARFALGSVADRLVREGSAPVLLIRRDTPTDQALKSAVVMLDGSGVAEHALPIAKQLAGKPIETITLFQAVASADDRAAAKTYLDAVATQLATSGSTINATVEVGDPRVAIDRAAREHDLVILSTHGRGGVDRLRHGSVAEAVVREVQAPVLLVRAPA
jgi:nucleotide-binding universal stress UspA family protein